MRFVPGPADCALVLPTRNRFSRLLQTLERIAQTPGPAVEVVIADNGSQDQTPRRIKQAFPKIKVLELGENLGTSARNAGAGEAESPIIFMLDDDSGPAPGTVEKIIAILEDPSIGAVACPIQLPDQSYEEGGSRHVFVGCGAAFRRKVFLDLGGYPREYETYVEEYDLAYRILAYDLAVEYVSDCVVWHEPAARDSFNYMVEKLTANNGYLAAKFYPAKEAAEFIAWMTFRYSIFARRKGAGLGFQKAVEALPGKILRGLTEHQILPDRVLDQILPQHYALPVMAALSIQSVRRIAFFRAGKEINGLIQAALDAGLEVMAIYEPPNGLLCDLTEIFGIPIQRYRGQPIPTEIDRLIIGGTSPGFIANTLRLAEENCLKNLVLPY